MGTTARDLFVAFDRSRRRSLRVQVEDGLREAIRSGRLRAGRRGALHSGGDLDRHLRRTRHIYRDRRDALIKALRRWLPRATPSGVSAGQNVLVTLPAGVDEQAVVQRALANGGRVYPLADYRPRPTRSDIPGMVLGYGSVPAGKVDHGVRLLARAVDEAGAER